MTKKISKADRVLINAAEFLGHTIYKCEEHGLFSSKDGDSKCPYCHKKCGEYKK